MENKKSSSKAKDGRVRNVAMELYEDSCNPDWKDLLVNEHIPSMWVYHDRDVNPTGEPKKPHYHLILCFENKKSVSQIQYFVDLFGAANGHYQDVNSIRGYARYLCHMDNPEKFQYQPSDVHTIAIDYMSIISLPTDRRAVVAAMRQFCVDNDIYSFADLFDYACLYEPEWFASLCDNSAYVMHRYLSSRSWTVSHDAKEVIDEINKNLSSSHRSSGDAAVDDTSI